MEGMRETVVVAALGMGVVFFFLALLSALMFLARIATERRAKSAVAALATSPPQPRWIAAAVAAFLAVEAAESAAVTARPWQSAARRRGAVA